MSSKTIYPDSVNWYLYASSYDGSETSEGTAVAVRLRKIDQPQVIETFLLTCAHVVRFNRNANGELGKKLDTIRVYPPGAGFAPGSGPEVEIVEHVVPQSDRNVENYYNSEVKNIGHADWVLLRFNDEWLRSLDEPGQAVEDWGEPTEGDLCVIGGYPGGRAAFRRLNNIVRPRQSHRKNPAKMDLIIGISDGVIALEGTDSRSGMSGGAVFRVQTGKTDGFQFIGLHRARQDSTLQLHAVSSEAIRRRLREVGYDVMTTQAGSVGDVDGQNARQPDHIGAQIDIENIGPETADEPETAYTPPDLGILLESTVRKMNRNSLKVALLVFGLPSDDSQDESLRKKVTNHIVQGLTHDGFDVLEQLGKIHQQLETSETRQQAAVVKELTRRVISLLIPEEVITKLNQQASDEDATVVDIPVSSPNIVESAVARASDRESKYSRHGNAVVPMLAISLPGPTGRDSDELVVKILEEIAASKPPISGDDGTKQLVPQASINTAKHLEDLAKKVITHLMFMRKSLGVVPYVVLKNDDKYRDSVFTRLRKLVKPMHVYRPTGDTCERDEMIESILENIIDE